MIYTLYFSRNAEKSIKKWRKSNPILYKKLEEILNEIIQHPREGSGRPEPLRGGGDITYSRRISGQHRIVYDIYDTMIEVHVLEVEGHYDDK